MTEDRDKRGDRQPRGRPAPDPDNPIDQWAARQQPSAPDRPYSRPRRRRFTSSIDHLRSIVIDD